MGTIKTRRNPSFAALFVTALAGLTVLTLSRTTALHSERPVPVHASQAEQVIERSERQWAAALSTGDMQLVEPLFADDLSGIDPTGKAFDKLGMLSLIQDGPSMFVSDQINNIRVRILGDVAVAQGDETWELRAGDVRRGSFLFTDTWVLRDGKWKVVASHSSMAPDTVK